MLVTVQNHYLLALSLRSIVLGCRRNVHSLPRPLFESLALLACQMFPAGKGTLSVVVYRNRSVVDNFVH